MRLPPLLQEEVGDVKSLVIKRGEKGLSVELIDVDDIGIANYENVDYVSVRGSLQASFSPVSQTVSFDRKARCRFTVEERVVETEAPFSGKPVARSKTVSFLTCEEEE